MNIRPETPRDYAAIANLNLVAFDERVGEPLVVTLLRHRALFDPELSLVAEIGERIVGHVMFSPQDVRLLGQDVRAVCLAPLAVAPTEQGKGIGAALVEEGHRIAREKGYTVSFLLGHDSYYPRFGYKTGVYGVSSLEVAHDAVRLPGEHESRLKARAVTVADIPALRDLWRREEGNIDFAIEPGDSRLDWVSPNPNMGQTIFMRDGEIVGFTRVLSTQPLAPRMFFAADNDAAHVIAATLMGDQPSVTLPLHPYSRSAEAFDTKPQVTPWSAGMACSLAPGPFDDYYAQLQEGKRLPGRVIWPVAFDLA